MSNPIFKPNLAVKFDEITQKFPVFASGKIDGFRALAMVGKCRMRSMKEIGNLFVRKWFADNAEILDGLDGELVVGDPFDPKCFDNTSGAMRRADGEPDFTYWVFDCWGMPDKGYAERLQAITKLVAENPLARLKLVKQWVITDQMRLDVLENMMLEQGYEGVMIRAPHGLYKQGRSSTKEGGLLKVKRFEDAEAKIVGFEEEMLNGNEAVKNEIGRTKRSSHKANKSGKGSLGAFIVEGVNGKFKGVRFKVGTGLSAEQRADFWQRQDTLLDDIITYKYFTVGSKDAPRHGVFKGFRPDFDMDAEQKGEK